MSDREAILGRIKSMKEKEPDVVMYPPDYKPEGIRTNDEPTLRDKLALILTQIPSETARTVISAAIGCAIEVAKKELRDEFEKDFVLVSRPRVGDER